MTGYMKIPIYVNDSSLNMYQNEVMNLLSFLKESHPAFLLDEGLYKSMHQSAKNLCTLLVNQEQWNRSKFQVWLNRFLSELNDAHSYIQLESSTTYPYIIRFFEGDFYLHTTIQSHKDTLGRVITHINNIEIHSIHERLSQWIPSENPIKSGIAGSHFLNNPFLLEAIGVLSSWQEVSITFVDGTQTTYTLNDHASDKVSHQSIKHKVTEPKNIPFFYQTVNDICYFQFNAMIDQISYQIGCQLMNKGIDTHILHSLPKFEDFLNEMYAEIEKKQIRTLVIDMRYNGGGNSLLGDILLESLLPDNANFKSYQSLVRISKFLKDSSFYYSSVKTDSNHLTNIETLPQIKEWEQRKKLGQRFNGKVYFIQGQNTFSSANYLLTTIKDNHLFPIIGSNTSQKPTCFGDVIPVLLPFTQTKAYISHSYFKRPCSDFDNENTLYPDIIIPNSIEEKSKGKDACWDWIAKEKE